MAHRYHRKLIRHGNVSLVISIPIEWIRFFELAPGDTVELISDDIITIKPLTGGVKKSGA